MEPYWCSFFFKNGLLESCSFALRIFPGQLQKPLCQFAFWIISAALSRCPWNGWDVSLIKLQEVIKTKSLLMQHACKQCMMLAWRRSGRIFLLLLRGISSQAFEVNHMPKVQQTWILRRRFDSAEVAGACILAFAGEDALRFAETCNKASARINVASHCRLVCAKHVFTDMSCPSYLSWWMLLLLQQGV